MKGIFRRDQEPSGGNGGRAGKGGPPNAGPNPMSRAKALQQVEEQRRTRDVPRDPDTLPSVAVLTMCRDEGPMIGRWVDHYSAAVGAENVFVLDDQSTDGSTDDLACTVLRFPPLAKYNFEPSRMSVLNGIASSMLNAYDAVIMADADEFIVADPARHAGLREFVATTDGRDAVGVLGYNVIHDTAHEEPLDFTRPFLEQRRLAKFLPLMCKPSLKWQAFDWRLASHGIMCPYEPDPGLVMFHLKFADRGTLERIAAARNASNRALRTSWQQTADEMVGLLDGINDGLATAERAPFEPKQEELDAIVRMRKGAWKAGGYGQVQAMREYPVREIPDRFTGLL